MKIALRTFAASGEFESQQNEDGSRGAPVTGNGEHSPAWLCPKSVISVSLGRVDAFALTVRLTSESWAKWTLCAAARRVQCSRSLRASDLASAVDLTILVDIP